MGRYKDTKQVLLISWKTLFIFWIDEKSTLISFYE